MPPSALPLIRWNGIHWIDLIYVLQSGWSSTYWSTAFLIPVQLFFYWPTGSPLLVHYFSTAEQNREIELYDSAIIIGKLLLLPMIAKMLRYISLTYLPSIINLDGQNVILFALVVQRHCFPPSALDILNC